MQTLKIKYSTLEDNKAIIREYQKQYSSALHYSYNRAIEGQTKTPIEHGLKVLHNIGLMDSYFISCAVQEGIQINSNGQNKVIFGGKKNFIDRCQGKITKEQYCEKRLSPIYSIGEANQKSNRKFQINENCNSFTFKPCKSTHINLEIIGGYRKYKKILERLYKLQETKSIPISYKLDGEYIYISFDEIKVSSITRQNTIENRVFAIDLNPNYVGWSVVDWENSSEFNVVKSGVISIKTLNDKEFALKKSKKNPNGYSSDHPKRIHLNNKRIFEVYEICKNLVNKALYYKCSLFCIEDLTIETSDKKKGSKYNSLCNKMWNRTKMVQNFEKRCNIFGLKLLKVLPNYSSFVGNFLFRDLSLPDMTLASIEIGRRGYEFYNQYIKKIKEKRKNIIQPEVKDFEQRFIKSLEEFDLHEKFKDLVEVYYFLKKSKYRYRVSLDELNLKFLRCFSNKSLITFC